MLKHDLNAKSRWLPLAILALSSMAAAQPPQDPPGDPGQHWPKEFDARGSKILVYEPQLETFRGSRMTSRAAVSVTREGASDPVFGSIWLDAVLNTDAQRKTVTPIVIKVTAVRFPNLSATEAAGLRQDFGDEIPRWNLTYSLDGLLAELKVIEERKAASEGLRTEVPQIFFRTRPAVLLSVEDRPSWGKSTDSSYQRLQNCAAFVVRNTISGKNYLQEPPFWWTSTDLLGPWETAENVPAAVEDQWRNEPKPQLPPVDPSQETPERPEVIPVSGVAELVWTDGNPQYASISGTDLLYLRNTDSDVFLDIQTQLKYALFSGRWYRTPQTKDAWEFVASDQLPADFSRIPLSSEKRHVLACVAGTPQAREAVANAEIPQTQAVRPGPAPDLQATYDGEPQFTDIPDLGLQYAVNTPCSIFHVPGRYYWCQDGIWYDSAFAVGPWSVCLGVPRVIYLIPPSCPHYYVTYCEIFGVTPDAVYVGYYPGYCGCYVWGGSVVYGTGWHYNSWIGNHCYGRPVTWGLGVQFDSTSCSWSIRPGGGTSVWSLHHRTGPPGRLVQAGVGGYWGGAPLRSSGVHDYRNLSVSSGNLQPHQNLYTRQPERLAPSSARTSGRLPSDSPSRPAASPPVRHEAGQTPLPPTSARETPHAPIPPRGPETPASSGREQPHAPPPPQNPPVPRTPPPPVEREVPRTPPPPRENHEPPRTPPPSPSRDKTRMTPPPRVQRVAPSRTSPAPSRAPQRAAPSSRNRHR